MMSLKREIIGDIVVILVVDAFVVAFFGLHSGVRWGTPLLPLQQLWPSAGHLLTAGPLLVVIDPGLAVDLWIGRKKRYARIIEVAARGLVARGYSDSQVQQELDKLRALLGQDQRRTNPTPIVCACASGLAAKGIP